jgi:hypothetical protein
VACQAKVRDLEVDLRTLAWGRVEGVHEDVGELEVAVLQLADAVQVRDAAHERRHHCAHERFTEVRIACAPVIEEVPHDVVQRATACEREDDDRRAAVVAEVRGAGGDVAVRARGDDAECARLVLQRCAVAGDLGRVVIDCDLVGQGAVAVLLDGEYLYTQRGWVCADMAYAQLHNVAFADHSSMGV